jgi:hypothetical protein
LIETPSIPAVPPRFVRLFGGLVAIALASGTLLMLYVAAAIPAVESVVHVQFVLGPAGFLPDAGSLATLLAWAAGSFAAGVSGVFFARLAARRERWAGAWMGLVTYFLALLVASLMPDLRRAIVGQTMWGQSLFEAVVGAPIMAVLAGSVLAPLFFLCVAAGLAWAWVVRRFASVPTSDPLPNTMMGGFAVSMLVFIGAMTVLGWIVFGSVFALLTGDGGPFID